MTDFYTLTPGDIGKRTFLHRGKTLTVPAAIGKVLPSDVGRRIYIKKDELVVEHNNEKKERTGK